MGRAFVGLGSNLGRRRENIQNAVRILDSTDDLELVKGASFYETEPIGPSFQPWFINTAIEITTQVPPLSLLQICKEVENRIGKSQSFPWGPRIIDLDILLYDDLVLDEANIVLPHPQLATREFVLRPLLELDPQLSHPRLKLPLSKILKGIEKEKKVIKLV